MPVDLPDWLVRLRRTMIVDRALTDRRSVQGKILGVNPEAAGEAIGWEQADFDTPWPRLSPEDRVLLYAYLAEAAPRGTHRGVPNDLREREAGRSHRRRHRVRTIHRRPCPRRGARPDMPVADALGSRLVEVGLLPEMPDQLIVNEYEGKKGISRHIDGRSFAEGIAMISLLETWEMNFRKAGRKVPVALARRSATIIRGEARSGWTHEIPKRKFEPSVAPGGADSRSPSGRCGRKRGRGDGTEERGLLARTRHRGAPSAPGAPARACGRRRRADA